MRVPRLTIGLVTANIHLGVGATLWSGALDAAQRHDVNLICFPGGEVGTTDRPRNSVYDLVGPEVLDGLICWTSTLGLPDAHAPGVRLARRFGRLPMVSLNGALGDDRPLTLDSYRGMCTAISHLIEVHGRRRLAFIRGTVANPVIVERYRAYTDTLARHRIPLDRTLISAPVDFHVEAGASAMRVLLDARALRPGHDFDGVVACSDFLAADALRMLSERGVPVPDDLAVIGVNDSPEARLAEPPLTSVSMPFAELGELAVETLVARLRGSATIGVPSPASTLVVRRSCGCPGTLLAEADDPADPGVDRLAELRSDVDGLPAGGVPGRCRERLSAGFLRALTDQEAGSAFLRDVDQLVGAWAVGGKDTDAWDATLLAMHRLAMAHVTGPVRARAERLVGRARLIVAEAGRRALEFERWQAEQTSRRLRDLGNVLSSAVDMPALTEALDRQLPVLGVPSWQLFAASTRPPAAVLPTGRRYSMVAEPLYVRDEHLGVALFEVGPRSGAVYRALGDQVSATMKEIMLFDEVREARDLAERADRVKTRLLSSVSDELRAPVQDIRRRVGEALRSVEEMADAPPPLVDNLKEIQVSAEHQLGVVSDLLDLSKAEIDTLDLEPELVDPGLLLEEVFRHTVSDRLPLIQADRRRLRQALVALHGCAVRLADGTGPVLVEADVRPPHLRIRLGRAGAVPGPDALDAGMALPITRRLLTLHDGSLRFESGRGRFTFHVTLPLPSPHGLPGTGRSAGYVLVVGELADDRGHRTGGLPVRPVRTGDDLTTILEDSPPAAVAWEVTDSRPDEWSLIRHLHDHALLRRTPFLMYGDRHGDLHGDVVARDLDEAITALRPAELAGPVMIADADPDTLATYRRIVAQICPGHVVLEASDGTSALATLGEDVPSLVIVSQTLPDMDGFDVLDRLHGDARRTAVPAVILSGQTMTVDDVARAEPYGRAVLLGKGILSDVETAALLTRLLEPRDALPQRTSVLVKHAIAYLHQHYHHQITRRQVAKAAGMSEDYLSRMFHRALRISPWDYLNRLRIQRAKERLRESDDSIQAVARRVGFHDRAYFSRIFRKLTGVPPQVYRASI